MDCLKNVSEMFIHEGDAMCEVYDGSLYASLRA
jgi:hypothetical protein